MRIKPTAELTVRGTPRKRIMKQKRLPEGIHDIDTVQFETFFDGSSRKYRNLRIIYRRIPENHLPETCLPEIYLGDFGFIHEVIELNPEHILTARRHLIQLGFPADGLNDDKLMDELKPNGFRHRISATVSLRYYFNDGEQSSGVRVLKSKPHGNAWHSIEASSLTPFQLSDNWIKAEIKWNKKAKV